MDAIKSLKQHFGFLETEYGLEPYRLSLDKWDKRWAPAVAYANDTTGVYVELDARESSLSISLHLLKDGKFPMRGGGISTAEGYPLNGIIYLSQPDALVDPWKGTASGAVDAISFDAYLGQAAAKLKQYAGDFLQGDFSRSAAVAQAIRAIMEERNKDS
jgi:hypothetical protein